MGSPWTQRSGIIPTDNFKIQPDLILQNPYGIFVEEIMYWCNTERLRIGMEPYPFYLYDDYALPDNLDDFKTENDKHWNGDDWQVEPSGNDPDTQKTPFAPDNDPAYTQLGGYYAFISNFIQDVAKSFNNTDPSGNPITSGHGLLQVMGMNGGAGHSAQVHSSISSLMGDSTPDTDADLNILRPKLGLACLTGNKIRVVNILGPMISDGTGANSGDSNIGDENKLNEFSFRDEDSFRLTGPSAMHFDGTWFWVVFGSFLRKFNKWGKAQLLVGDKYALALNGTATSLIGGSNVYYVAGGKMRKLVVPTDTDTEVVIKQYNTVGRTTGEIVDGCWWSDLSGGQQAMENIRWASYSDGAGIVDPELSDFNNGISRLVSSNIISSDLPLILKGDKLYGVNEGNFQTIPFVNTGEYYVDSTFNIDGGADDIITIGKPYPLTYYTNVEGKTPFNTSKRSNTFLKINGGTGEHGGLHNFATGDGYTLTNFYKYSPHPEPGEGNITTPEEDQFSISPGGLSVAHGLTVNLPAYGIGWAFRETSYIREFDLESYADEKALANMLSPQLKAIFYMNLGYPAVLTSIDGTVPGEGDEDDEDFEWESGDEPPASITLKANIYTGNWPPTTKEDLDAKGSEVFTYTHNGIKTFLEPGSPSLAYAEDPVNISDGDISDGKIRIIFSMERRDYLTDGFLDYPGPSDSCRDNCSATFGIGISQLYLEG